MWKTTSSGLFYIFSWTGGQYDLIITDLSAVWQEDLADMGPRARDLQLPFDLGSSSNAERVGELLSGHIDDVDFNSTSAITDTAGTDAGGMSGHLQCETCGIAWQWKFELQRLGADEAAVHLTSVSRTLRRAFHQALEFAATQQEVIGQKDLVIQGLEEASRRGVAFRAPPFLAAAAKKYEGTIPTWTELAAEPDHESSDSDATI